MKKMKKKEDFTKKEITNEFFALLEAIGLDEKLLYTITVNNYTLSSAGKLDSKLIALLKSKSTNMNIEEEFGFITFTMQFIIGYDEENNPIEFPCTISLT
jgi:hypothetical protein